MAATKLNEWLAKYGTTTFDMVLGFVVNDVEDNGLKDELLTMSEELKAALQQYILFCVPEPNQSQAAKS